MIYLCIHLCLFFNGPREDATRIGSAGAVRIQVVDISPLHRVNQAIYLLTTGAREAAFRNIKTVKTIVECLADELINAAKGFSNMYANSNFIPGHMRKSLLFQSFKLCDLMINTFHGADAIRIT